MVALVPHNTDESAIHTGLLYLRLVEFTSCWCVFGLVSLYINKVLVWTHTDTLFLISRLDVLVAASAATGYSCEKSEFRGTAIICRGSFFFV